MIYFDGTRVFGTVSYYLWKLMSVNRPDEMLAVTTEFPEAKPVTIAGQIGVGTWDATAEFKDIRVERDGQLVFRGEDAPTGDTWQRDGGRWTAENGVFRQRRRGYGISYFGDRNWSDYTLTLKARKSSGGEGFLIVFGRQDSDRYWWNLGGWGNQQHAIEQNQSPVGRPVRGRIESDRWYDVKIELSGQRIRCYLDGKLIHDATVTPPQEFFVNAGRDRDDGGIVLKAINTGPIPQQATLVVHGVNDIAPQAALTVLSSASLMDNNSLRRPAAVVPVETEIAIAGTEFEHEFPPRSLSIIRLKPQSE